MDTPIVLYPKFVLQMCVTLFVCTCLSFLPDTFIQTLLHICVFDHMNNIRCGYVIYRAVTIYIILTLYSYQKGLAGVYVIL